MSTAATVALSKEQAIRIVALAIDSLKQPANEAILKSILDECAKETDPMVQFQLKLMKLVPKILEILGSQIEDVLGLKTEQAQVMGYVTQVQAMAATDVKLSIETGKIMKTLGGDFSGLFEEECDDGEAEPEEID